MATPTIKAESVEAFIDTFIEGPGRKASITANICTRCRRPATRFSDTLSKREFTISGLCQECQDGFFEDCDARERAEDAADRRQG